jgi:TPP-dependent pyruvate/acetoin dehydrogenase alpha subunit
MAPTDEERLPAGERRGLMEGLLLARRFEETVLDAYEREGIPELPHSSLGQEAVGVGATAVLEDDDVVAPSLRTRAAILLRVPLNQVVAGMFGTRSGPSSGRTTQHHMGSREAGILGTTGLVGSHLKGAVGAGLSSRLLGRDRVSLVFFGDGATTRGEFHTALNFAAVRDLPVVFLIENNGWTEATRIEEVTPVEDLVDLVGPYLPKRTVDGQDADAVAAATREAADRARAGDGPTLIEAKTRRYRPHAEVMADDRTDEELAALRERDPIELYRSRLLEEGVADEDWIEETDAEVTARVEAAFDAVADDPLPDEDAMYHVYRDADVRPDGTVAR